MVAEQVAFASFVSRRCSMCGIEKPLNEFHRRGDGYQRWCKACRKTYDAAYHAATREIRLNQKKKWKANFLAWMRKLKDVSCADCGGRFHPAAMQFDHLPGAEKLGEIATLVRDGRLKLARDEVLKCEVVCANCHAIRTFRRREEQRAKKHPTIREDTSIYLIAA